MCEFARVGRDRSPVGATAEGPEGAEGPSWGGRGRTPRAAAGADDGLAARVSCPGGGELTPELAVGVHVRAYDFAPFGEVGLRFGPWAVSVSGSADPAYTSPPGPFYHDMYEPIVEVESGHVDLVGRWIVGDLPSETWRVNLTVVGGLGGVRLATMSQEDGLHDVYWAQGEDRWAPSALAGVGAVVGWRGWEIEGRVAVRLAHLRVPEPRWNVMPASFVLVRYVLR